MLKTIMVKTDDPENEKFYLKIVGKIKAIIRITPDTVNLQGIAGQTLHKVVTIEPVQTDKLQIREMDLKYGKQIKAELIGPGQEEKIWKVKISCHCDHAADMYDFITLTTDNPARPYLKIRVYATFEKPVPVKKTN